MESHKAVKPYGTALLVSLHLRLIISTELFGESRVNEIQIILILDMGSAVQFLSCNDKVRQRMRRTNCRHIRGLQHPGMIENNKEMENWD